jgi:hypothetical protein
MTVADTVGFIAVNKLTDHPGACLILLWWWVAPFLVVDLVKHAEFRHISGFWPYVATVIVVCLCAAALQAAERRAHFWSRSGRWSRFIILIGCYAVSVIAVLTVILILYNYGVPIHFNGDPEGSFGMLLIPSIVGYATLGVVVNTGLSIRAALRRRERTNSAEK